MTDQREPAPSMVTLATVCSKPLTSDPNAPAEMFEPPAVPRTPPFCMSSVAVVVPPGVPYPGLTFACPTFKTPGP